MTTCIVESSYHMGAVKWQSLWRRRVSTTEHQSLDWHW